MMSADGDLAASPLLGAAIAAYVGRGRRKIPTADAAAVFGVSPTRYDELLREVTRSLLVADSIPRPEVGRSEMKHAVEAEIRRRMPRLDDTGVDALVWRWGFLAFGE